jgi:hypothetical protein
MLESVDAPDFVMTNHIPWWHDIVTAQVEGAGPTQLTGQPLQLGYAKAIEPTSLTIEVVY